MRRGWKREARGGREFIFAPCGLEGGEAVEDDEEEVVVEDEAEDEGEAEAVDRVAEEAAAVAPSPDRRLVMPGRIPEPDGAAWLSWFCAGAAWDVLRETAAASPALCRRTKRRLLPRLFPASSPSPSPA